MYILENDQLTVTVNPKGAELIRIYGKEERLDYLWSGDPIFWAKHSPVLFPIVGALKDNIYYFNKKAYTLPRHGFARDCIFGVKEITNESIAFSLKYDNQSLAVYPFLFELTITYSLRQKGLNVAYKVANLGTGTMYFSLGAHPAFRVPLVEGTEYSDYRLDFDQTVNLARWPITANGLIGPTPEIFISGKQSLPLSKHLFERDALVFKHPVSETISLVSDITKHGLRFHFEDFPYLGLWAAPGADFVCIEPWCGIADADNTSQQLTDKEGIHELLPAKQFDRSWKVEFF